MAKLSRKQRQKQKQKQQNKLLKTGLKPSQIQQLSNKEIEQKYTSIVTEERKQNQRKQTRRKQVETRAKKLDFKRNSLEALGFDRKYATRVKHEDIEAYKRGDKNALSRDKYPFLYFGKFDFNTVYSFKNNQRLYVAFRDYQGELDFSEILARYSKYSNGELVDFLESIVNTPPTYKKGVTGSSSGRAGDYKFMLAPQEIIKAFNNDTYNETRRNKYKKKNKRRMHSQGEKVGFQVLKNGRLNSHDEVTPRNLLIVANALMYNITEQERGNFYSRFYTDITRHIPDMKEILPKPKF